MEREIRHSRTFLQDGTRFSLKIPLGGRSFWGCRVPLGYPPGISPIPLKRQLPIFALGAAAADGSIPFHLRIPQREGSGTRMEELSSLYLSLRSKFWRTQWQSLGRKLLNFFAPGVAGTRWRWRSSLQWSMASYGGWPEAICEVSVRAHTSDDSPHQRGLFEAR